MAKIQFTRKTPNQPPNPRSTTECLRAPTSQKIHQHRDGSDQSVPKQILLGTNQSVLTERGIERAREELLRTRFPQKPENMAVVEGLDGRFQIRPTRQQDADRVG